MWRNNRCSVAENWYKNIFKLTVHSRDKELMLGRASHPWTTSPLVCSAWLCLRGDSKGAWTIAATIGAVATNSTDDLHRCEFNLVHRFLLKRCSQSGASSFDLFVERRLPLLGSGHALLAQPHWSHLHHCPPEGTLYSKHEALQVLYKSTRLLG